MNYSKNNIDDTELPNPAIGEISSDGKTRLFTKEQVNKIVEERLKKERTKLGALKELKDAVTNLYERGYFDKHKEALGKNLAISDMAGIVLAEIENLKKTGPDVNLREIHETNEIKEPGEADYADIADISEESEAIKPIGAKMPPEWSMNPRIFEMFAEKKNLPMEEILNEYLKFVVRVEQSKPSNSDDLNKFTDVRDSQFNGSNAPAVNYGAENDLTTPGNFYNNKEQILGTKNQNNIYSDYRSVPTAQGYRTGESFNLTERQKELARAGGMTYREYNEVYNSIPTKKLKK